MEDLETIKGIAEDVYAHLKPYCIAIYLGGSLCMGTIEHAHDVDFICFADEPVNMCHIRRMLYFYQKRHPLDPRYDFIQVRTKRREERRYGSYVNKKMIKLVGEDIRFDFDVIDKDRWEYVGILKETIHKLTTGKIRNQKRWYQVVYGYFIVKNRSYDLTEGQKSIVNAIHDQVQGWQKHKITIRDLDMLLQGG